MFENSIYYELEGNEEVTQYLYSFVYILPTHCNVNISDIILSTAGKLRKIKHISVFTYLLSLSNIVYLC